MRGPGVSLGAPWSAPAPGVSLTQRGAAAGTQAPGWEANADSSLTPRARIASSPEVSLETGPCHVPF